MRILRSLTFILKFASEVAHAADQLIELEEYQHLTTNMFRSRRSPKYSLLSYVLTQYENTGLEKIIAWLQQEKSLKPLRLMYDGGVFGSGDKRKPELTDYDLERLSSHVEMPISTKSWFASTTAVSCFPLRLFICGLATMDETPGARISRLDGA